MSNILNYQSLPQADNINPYAFSIEVRSEMFIQMGKMIAYYGNLKFEKLGSGMFDMLVRSAFNSPTFANNFIVVTGQGKLILGDHGHNIASYDLEAGALTVKAQHVLGFEPTIFCQESTLPGYLAMSGTGKFLASSNGPVHFMEPPCRVDEQALLGWADVPSPSYYYDYEHVRSVFNLVGTFFGTGLSGEEKQVDFTGKGNVLVQSSELGMAGSADPLQQAFEKASLLDPTQRNSLVQRIMQLGR